MGRETRGAGRGNSSPVPSPGSLGAFGNFRPRLGLEFSFIVLTHRIYFVRIVSKCRAREQAT